MEIFRYRCFVALSEYLSFTNAADALHISQSSMSKHIMQLERELDVQLFERKGRSTQLTEAGLSLVKHIKSIIVEYDYMMQTVAGYINSASKTTQLGIAPMGCQNKFIRLLREIMSKNSQQTLKIVEREEVELINDVTHGSLDIIIIRKEILPSSGFRTHKILSEGALVMLPASNPLSEAECLDFYALRNENFIFMDEYTAPYKIFLEASRNAGFEPNIVRTAKTEIIMINCVRDGEGICLFFRNDTDLYHFFTDIKLVPLKENILSDIVLAVPGWKKATPMEKMLSIELKNRMKTV